MLPQYGIRKTKQIAAIAINVFLTDISIVWKEPILKLFVLSADKQAITGKKIDRPKYYWKYNKTKQALERIFYASFGQQTDGKQK